MKKSQQELLSKAKQSLKASKVLLNEEFNDFAVARAYYTMFYIASAFLAGEDLVFSKHSAVISAFGREFAKTEKLPRKFHQYIKEAQGLRLMGDYGGINLITFEDAQLQIKKAEEMLIFANQYLS